MCARRVLEAGAAIREMGRAAVSEATVGEAAAELAQKVAAGEFPQPKRFTSLMRRATEAEPGRWPIAGVKQAEQVFRLGVQLYERNNYLWAEMIACCTRCKDTAKAEQVYGEWQARGGVGVLVREAMMAHYQKNGNIGKMQAVFEELRKNRLVASSYAAASLATSFARFGEVEKAVAVFRSPGNASWASADGVVAQLGRKGRMAEALAVLGDAAKLGASPRQSAVNNVLRAAAKSGEKSAVYSAVDRMRDRADHVAAGIADEDEESAAALCSPTEQTYRMILVGLAHSPSNVPLSPAEVRHHLQCAADLAPSGVCDARTFAAAALAYLRCNNSVNHALMILKRELVARGLAVPFGLWDRLIAAYEVMFATKFSSKSQTRAYAREGALLKVWRLLREAYAQAALEEMSPYQMSRWRSTVLQLALKLRRSQSVEAVVAEVLVWPCFSELTFADGEALVQAEDLCVQLVVSLLRDGREDVALDFFAKHLSSKRLEELLSHHAVVGARGGNVEFAQALVEFAELRKLRLGSLPLLWWAVVRGHVRRERAEEMRRVAGTKD